MIPCKEIDCEYVVCLLSKRPPLEWGNLHKVRGYAGCAERCPSGVGRGKRPRRKSEPYLSVSVDYMFDGLERRSPQHFAVRQYKKYKLASGDICSK